MNSQTVSNNPNILTHETWHSYIDKKKIELLTYISSSNYLENTSENIKFISIIKELVNCNLFNISNLAFCILKLLENSFIDSDILYEAVSDTNTTTKKGIVESNEYLDTLKKYLHLIIDNIVYIELSLNIHFIIIINNLQKLKKQKSNLEANLKDNIYVSPKIFYIFEKINNDIITTIKPSSHILLFLKLIRKLGNFHINSLNTNIFTNKNTNKTIEYNNYMKNNKETSNKIKYTLDSFIINITNFYESKDYKDNYKDIIIKCPLDTSLNSLNITHSVNNNITSICQNYITLVVKVLFTEFNNLFDILATHLKSSKSITEEKLEHIISIKTTLSNMINIEIEKIKNKLLFDK